MKDNNRLCPSYAPTPGAKLYGIVNKNGFINYLKDTMTVSKSFLEEASKGKDLDKKFRFAGNCAKSGCEQWDNKSTQCGLINTIINIVNNPALEELTYCPIREKCRWYAQRQGLACAQCSEIIRNIETRILEQ